MALRLITAPAVLPLTLTEVKQHLRVDYTEADDLITAYIEAATSYVQGEFSYTGRALVTQTWQLVIDHFPVHEIKIPLPPLQSITSIEYDGTDGLPIILATDQYAVDDSSEPAWIVPTTAGWPTAVLNAINAVRIEFIAGYPATSDSPPDLRANIPASIKQALLLLIGQFHEHREENVVGLIANRLPFASENL